MVESCYLVRSCTDLTFAEEVTRSNEEMAAERVAERATFLKAVLDLHLLTCRRTRRHGTCAGHGISRCLCLMHITVLCPLRVCGIRDLIDYT